VLRRYFHQRLVFVGDSAHSLSPALGQGARLALAGAANLAAALERYPVADALAAYDQRQRGLVTRYQRWSRWLTPVFQSQHRSALWIRDRVIPLLARLAPIERNMSRLLCGTVETG
jgi:2-polyprenyl-6-methoxyphenol hydroxylase-like FAD-dependent oxidoreductase